MDPCSMAYIGLVGALLGAIIGAILGATITYYFSLKITAINTQRIAGAKLRATFAPEIANYYLLGEAKFRDFDITLMTHDVKKIFEKMFKEALPRHAAAIEEYRCFVRPEFQRVYQQAWENYHRPPCANGSVYFGEYVDRGGKELFKHRIDAIFKFTEI